MAYVLGGYTNVNMFGTTDIVLPTIILYLLTFGFLDLINSILPPPLI